MTSDTRTPVPQSGIAGLRVIDLSGPPAALCGKILADLGADVVRFEPAEGDLTRRLPPFAGDDRGELGSLYFWYFNANKRSCRLDLRTEAGRARLLDLVPRADVLLESYAPGHLERLGLGVDALRRRNPELVVASITPFGQTGPFRDYRGSDLVGWASGGCLMLTGHPARPPLTAPGTQAYHVASLNAAIAVLAALRRRGQGRGGAHLDISVQETVVSMAETMWSFYAYQGERVVRADGDHPLACPFRVFATRDGYAFVGLSGRAQWEALLKWMAESIDISAVADPQFFETNLRAQHRDLINGTVAAWAKTQTNEELFLKGAQLGVPNAPVRAIPELLEDEQLRDRRFFASVPDPRNGATYPTPGLPYRTGPDPLRTQSTPAPRIGADTEAVLAEWRRGDGATGRRGEALTPSPRRPVSPSPLAGVRVLELAWQVAGTTVARVLGDLGADVVKVEAREVGDPLRGITPFKAGVFGYNRSGTFNDLNRNKRSLTLDLKHPRAREVIERLVRWADIATENFTAGTLDRLGIPYPVLRQMNPRVILTSVAGYGQTGPRRTWPCFHPTASALSGLTGLFAYEDGPPSGFGNSYLDYMPGYVGALGAIEALLRRERTGEGAHVDVSQVETGVYLVGTELFEWQVNGAVPRPQGNRAGALGAPLQDVFACREPDTWLAVTAPDAEALVALANLLGLGPVGATHASPLPDKADLDRIHAALTDWLREREAWAAFHALQQVGVPAGVAEQGPDLLERDPHLRERGMFVTPTHPEMGPAVLPRGPVWVDGQPSRIERPAPVVGEHTDEILRDIAGFSEEEIADLIVNEVV